MNIKFTKHSLQQAEKRGITQEEVEAFFAAEVFQVAESKQDPSVVMIRGFVKRKPWMFIVNRDTLSLITLYPLRK